jgi:hypothetical protein
MFGQLIECVNKKLKPTNPTVLFLGPYEGQGMILNAIWSTSNHVKYGSVMQVIPMASHWICMLSYIQSTMKYHDLVFGCNRLENDARVCTASTIHIKIF